MFLNRFLRMVSIVYVVLIYVHVIALILLNATLQYQMVSTLGYLENHPTEVESSSNARTVKVGSVDCD